jgi:tetratricopeptide (TPR) repeat protein
MADRIKALQAMIAKSPADVFLHYSLGMELLAAGLADQAVGEFGHCVRLDANYLPAYVESGKALRAAGLLGQARDMFAAGMELAALTGENHVRDFIQQQLDGLPKSAD